LKPNTCNAACTTTSNSIQNGAKTWTTKTGTSPISSEAVRLPKCIWSNIKKKTKMANCK
jgi:hypothetical protein